VITGPEEVALSGRGHLRAAHADREHVIDLLKVAFVQGRLAKDELDMRTGQALTARTYAPLAALTDDIPAGPLAASVPGQSARPQNRPNGPGRCETRPLMAAAGIMGYGIVGAVMARRSRRQLPPRPGRGVPAPRGAGPAPGAA
jgi:hypothetical protein